MYTLLSLFDYTGNWSKPYKDNGWNVIQVDIKHGLNVLTFDYKSIPKVQGILLAPPCTHFALTGARWFAEKDRDGRTTEHVTLVRKGLEIVDWFKPQFWALEQPATRLHKLVPEIGTPLLKFQPYHYGDPYRKQTWLFGRFNHNLVRDVVIPQGIRQGQPDEWYSKVGGKSEATKEYRSKTPTGFAYAFYKANS